MNGDTMIKELISPYSKFNYEAKGILVGDPILPLQNVYLVIERGDFRTSKNVTYNLATMAEAKTKHPRKVII